ncbi:MAG: CBS domain-containing protein [Gammaproteobacteria bacterium]|nr:CBS domain-containing protein [Gammaproteobacteria bacterium]MCP4875535.1 CBS domain-containing protein [Gammaproteobacteria bacterium]MCP4982661.1 CBS domain-containing protein [Gammaproteobacteria bacterium]
MKLAELIRGKSHEIVKIKANQSIAEAAIALGEHKIGALLVEDQNGDIAGILSERDIVGGMAPHGADLHDVAVSELMTVNIIHCSPQDTVNEAMAMMTDRRIRHLPVFDDDELVGFISIGDLVKCRIMEVQSEAEALRQYIAS